MNTCLEALAFARRTLVQSLHEPRHYRVGKVTLKGVPKSERVTLLNVQGPGVFKRLWTTHANADRIRIHLFVDDHPQPVLSGDAHELAQAAQRICCPRIPLGGFDDRRSTNLFLPISFKRSLRIDAEPTDDPGDGPYWQIDYALDCEKDWPMPRQVERDGRIEILYDDLSSVMVSPAGPTLPFIEEEIALSGASPRTFWLEGGGIIRRVVISSRDVDSLLLRIAFDGERGEEDRLDGPFQVDAPLRYLVGSFNNACVERLGSTAIIHFPMPYRVRAGLQVLAAMDYGSFHEKHPVQVRVEYEPDAPPAESMRYFHARFRSAMTNGHDDFECCATHGRGHFVGVHLFDTGHDHGGGDNIFFDAAADSAGQLHGICGEDYFHMAYMRVWNLTPYSGCPSHAARYRHHLEMPIPFEESFVFNWGSFASQPAKAVAFWYLDRPEGQTPAVSRELVYTLTGPFELTRLDDLKPGAAFPSRARVWADGIERPTQSWLKQAQCGFVDLCHVHRKYLWPVPPSSGGLTSDICTCAEARLWSARDAKVVLRVGCDDPIRVYVNGQQHLSDDGRHEPNPFKLFKIPLTLRQGVNHLRVVVGNRDNCNWKWNGFSLVVDSDLDADELACLV